MQTDTAELDKIQHRVERLWDPKITFRDLSQWRFRADMCETYKILHYEYGPNPDNALNDNFLRGYSFKLLKTAVAQELIL